MKLVEEARERGMPISVSHAARSITQLSIPKTGYLNNPYAQTASEMDDVRSPYLSRRVLIELGQHLPFNQVLRPFSALDEKKLMFISNFLRDLVLYIRRAIYKWR